MPARLHDMLLLFKDVQCNTHAVVLSASTAPPWLPASKLQNHPLHSPLSWKVIVAFPSCPREITPLPEVADCYACDDHGVALRHPWWLVNVVLLQVPYSSVPNQCSQHPVVPARTPASPKSNISPVLSMDGTDAKLCGIELCQSAQYWLYLEKKVQLQWYISLSDSKWEIPIWSPRTVIAFILSNSYACFPALYNNG